MKLLNFTTNFSNIGNQASLRPNVGYRYFFDVQDAKIYPQNHSIQLKYVLQEVKTSKVSKGELDDIETLVEMCNIERRFNNLINLELVSEIGSDKNILQEGDIVIPKMQPQMGNMFLNLEHRKFVASTELLEYKISKEFHPIFLYYLITSSKFLTDLGKLENGKTHRRVNTHDLLKIKIPIIGKEKQNIIIKEIESIQCNIVKLKKEILSPQDIINRVFIQHFGFDIENADKRQKQLEHYASLEDFANEELKFDISLKYRYIFQNHIQRTTKYEWIEIDKVVIVKGGKRLPKGQNVTDEETDYRYIRVEDLSWSGLFDLNNIKYISEENHFAIKNYIAKEDDILITIVGATVGKCGLVTTELDGENISENFARLIIRDKKNHLPEYINYFLQSKISTYQINEYKGRGSQGKLALFRIKKIKMPKISLHQQNDIVKEIKIALNKQELLKSQITMERTKIDYIIEQILNDKI